MKSLAALPYFSYIINKVKRKKENQPTGIQERTDTSRTTQSKESINRMNKRNKQTTKASLE